MQKRTIVIASLATLLVGGAVFFRTSSFGTDLIWRISEGGTILFPLLVVSALIDSINPCAFSILLLTVGFLVGLGARRMRVLRIGGAYVAGLFLVYLLIGLGILGTLHIFNTPHFMAKAGAALLLVLGTINLLNFFFPAFPIKIRIPAGAHRAMARLMEKASLPTAFALGALVGICEFPCTGGPYLMVLGLLHDQGTYLAGFGYLILYNLIFIIPLVVILLLASEPALLERVAAWRRRETKAMRFVTGAAMVVLAAIIFFI